MENMNQNISVDENYSERMKYRNIELNILKSMFSYIKNSNPIKNWKIQKGGRKMLELSKLQKGKKKKRQNYLRNED